MKKDPTYPRVSLFQPAEKWVVEVELDELYSKYTGPFDNPHQALDAGLRILLKDPEQTKEIEDPPPGC